MKSYTDIDQSRKLAEILAIESADYTRLGKDEDNVLTRSYLESCSSELKEWIGKDEIYPCWSLAALLDILPAECECMSLEYSNYGGNKKYYVSYVGGENTEDYDNPIDACYEMIVWLKENGKL